ncbi:CHAT domain-containing protein [Ephemerocybe angulata]|uniref:CHAT domain-containing protein n=1 Tax=Ephemerocybe angulata TaxID=980116 RepID=A0A8H6MAF6_9AGAR|nr:CHAT domain-containing protein [Tulosesus angulatus]
MRPASILALIPLALSMGLLANANDYTFDSREYVDELSAREDHFGDALAAREILSDISTQLDEAISSQRRVLRCSPADHPIFPGFLNNLANFVLHRFKHSGDVFNLNEAISIYENAAQLTPLGHPELSSRLINLGSAIQALFDVTKETSDLDCCTRAYKSAVDCMTAPPSIRLDAATRWARALTQHRPHSSDEILPAFDAAISLLALTAGLENSVEGRYAQLQFVSGLPSEAAAAALTLGRTDKAIEWLEQGRCLVWGQLNLLCAGAPIDDLRAHDGRLAQDVTNVLQQLERAGSTRETANANMSLSEKIALQDEERAHLELSRKWDGLLATIQAIPGFETFSQPPSPYATLANDLPWTEGGYIVIINVSDDRCDSMVILRGTSEPVHVALPRFSLAKSNEYRNILGTQLMMHNLRRRTSKPSDEEVLTRALRRVRVGEASHRPNPIQDVLRVLWQEVVKPILEALAIPRIDDQEAAVTLPRIWWCPTGPLAFLPLHAARVYGFEVSEAIHNYAISSYTLNVSFLIARVRGSRSNENEATSGLFLTSKPSPPGASPIPGTIREVRLINDMAAKKKTRVLKVEGDEVTVDECLEYMEQYSSIHLACHASQDTIDPLQSRFLFHKGALSLGSTIQRNVKNADVAFLSACETGTGEEKVSDEVVHLAAGMLAAGYCRVVAGDVVNRGRTRDQGR